MLHSVIHGMEYVTNAVPSWLQFILRFHGGVHVPFCKFILRFHGGVHVSFCKLYLIVNTVYPHV